MRRLGLVSRALGTFAMLGALGTSVALGAVPARAQFPVDSVQAAARVISPADSALDARTRAVAATLRCPVCQGLSLQDSPSELAQEMRAIIRQQLRDGRTPDDVRAFFVARYGDWILMTPPRKGVGWLVYVLPVVVLGGGGALLVIALRRWVRSSPASSPQHVGHSDAV